MHSAKMRLYDAQQIMDSVYGPYTGPGWYPRPFARHRQRDLWADSFGVCGYITLHYLSKGHEMFLKQADALIAEVHNVLGCYRYSYRRLGRSTEQNPLLGGLRIGAEHENDDGQLFHYSAMWMFALNRMSRARGVDTYNAMAIQLAKAVHPHFVFKDNRFGKKMFFKLTIEKDPLRLFEGDIDAVIGLVVYQVLNEAHSEPDILQSEIADMEEMALRKCETFTSKDVLDIGISLWCCSWFPKQKWAGILMDKCLAVLGKVVEQLEAIKEPKSRLMFREMGLILGMQCVFDDKALEQWKSYIDRAYAFWEERIFACDTDMSALMFIASKYPELFKREPDRSDDFKPD